jgi:C-terminal processing protease CtpA/Prc
MIMLKHLVTATAAIVLALVGPAIRADNRDPQRAQRHMQGYLGVRVDTAARGSEKTEGVAIGDLLQDGPAAKAGLRKGDIITQVGRRVVEDFDDLSNAITRHQPGDTVTIHVRRDGKEQNFRVKLSERPSRWLSQAEEKRDAPARSDRQGKGENQGRDVQQLERWLAELESQLQEQTRKRGGQSGSSGSGQRSAYLGVQTQQWTPSAKQRRDLKTEGGVEIMEAAPGSPASDAGLMSGDVIAAVNGRGITTPDQLYQVVQRAGPGREITLDVLRGEEKKKFRAVLSAGGEDILSLRRLARQIEQMEKQLAQKGRYGLIPRKDDPISHDLQEIQRQIRELDKHLREIDKNRMKSDSKDKKEPSKN